MYFDNDGIYIETPTNSNESDNQTKLKRPLNSYNLYYKEVFQKKKSEFPDLSGNEISKIVGQEWKNMPEEKKKNYVEKAMKIKDDFRKKNPNYHYNKTGIDKNNKRCRRGISSPIDQTVLNEDTLLEYFKTGSLTLAKYVLSRKDVLDDFIKYLQVEKNQNMYDVSDNHYGL